MIAPLLRALFVSLPLGLAVSGLSAQPKPSSTESLRYERWHWLHQQRAFPANRIPDGALARGLKQIRQAQALRAPVPGGAAPLAASERWSNIGPTPILGIPSDDDADSSGRVAYIAVDPGQTNHWLIGASQGGVWETRDAGASWTPLTDDQASLAMGAVVFAPSNNQIIYAGTGEPHGSDSYAGAGLLKSTNGGASWQLLAIATFAKTAFSDLKVHPSDPNIVMAATSPHNGAFPEHNPPPVIPPTGVFRSADGGVNWTQTLTGEATDLEVHPGDFNKQYAGLGKPVGDTPSSVFRSMDGGQGWAPIAGPWATATGGVGRVELALAPSDANVLYASIADDKGSLLGIWRTGNAWDAAPNWSEIDKPANAGGQWDYGHEIIVDPANANTFYVGGVSLFKYNGTAWTNLYKDPNDPTVAKRFHVDQHAMAWAGTRLILGDDGGVFSSPDGGVTWNNNNGNLALTQFYAGAVHPANTNLAYGGSQDQGAQAWKGTNAWQEIIGGDGAECAFSPTDPDNHWAVSAQKLSIQRTKNGKDLEAADGGIADGGRPFVGRFSLSPSKENIAIAGSTNLWRCNDFFSGTPPSWTLNGPTTTVPIGGATITALAFAPSDINGNTYAFGTEDGQLRLTTTSGETWTDIRNPQILPGRFVSGLAFNPTNAAILFVTFSGFNESTPEQPGHVFKTGNAEATTPSWSSITTPVNLPHNTIALDPVNPDRIFVGTDLGIWQSGNGGAAWTHMGPSAGMPNVAVFDLRINPLGRIVAFTHGRGAFTLVSSAAPTAALSIARSGANAIVSWPAPGNLVLQSTPSLSGTPAWNDVAGAPAVVGNQYAVTNDASAGSLFFRLKSP